MPGSSNPDLAALEAAIRPMPVGDRFLDTSPAHLDRYQPGQVIAERDEITTVPAVAGVAARRALQVKFRSTDSRGEPSYGTATLIVPAMDWTGPGERPVLVDNWPIDGLGFACTPGYELLHDAPTAPAGVGVPSNTQWGIGQGFAVLIPDHEGPRMAYAEPTVAGHEVLDSMRAVRALLPGEFGTAPFALYGYSGGAIAARAAVVLASSYAPELTAHIVGAGIGGVPADFAMLTRTLDGDLATGALLAAIFGIGREHPEVLAAMNRAARWLAMSPAKEDCGDLAELYGVFGLPVELTTDVPDPLHSSLAADILRMTDLSSLKSAAPLYVYGGAQDPWIPPAMGRELVRQQCALGVAAMYRDVPGEHFLASELGAAGVWDWLGQRLRGKPAPDECPR